MRKASLPILEFSTLIVVISGCVIAVVPGADDYVRHWLSGQNSLPEANFQLMANCDDSKPNSRTQDDYPERFASLKPVPIGQQPDLLLIDDEENKLPVPHQDALTAGNDDAHEDDILLSLEPAAESPDLPIIDDWQEADLPIAMKQENSGLTDGYENVDDSEIDPTNEDLGIVGNAPDTQNWTPNTTWSSNIGKGPQVIRNPMFDPQNQGTVERTKNILIRNRFIDDEAYSNPMDINNKEYQDKNWEIQQLPAFQPIRHKPDQRFPMSADSMQSDNSFQLPSTTQRK